MIIAFYIVLIIYTFYWLILDFYFHKKTQETNNITSSIPFCSIIICARNEEQHISQCLQTMLQQKNIDSYVEIILVDDGSADNTTQIAEQILKQYRLPYQIIKNNECMGKKKCIEKAIQHASPKSQFIILRDADTFTYSNDWLMETIQNLHNTDLLIAPVVHQIQKHSIIEFLQYYEGLALLHLTKSSWKIHHPILCSASNLAFHKNTFIHLRPYQHNYHIPTGDDIFLLNQFYSSNKNIHLVFSKNNLVYTYSPYSLKSLFKQKLRWLSKTSTIKNNFNTFSALLMAITHLSLFALLFISPLHFMLLFILKLFIDLKIIYSVRKTLNLQPYPLIYFFIAELLYIPYVCALILGHFLIKKQ
ncbi:MAG: glycosyltransferase [Bacteroidota bacterium]